MHQQSAVPGSIISPWRWLVGRSCMHSVLVYIRQLTCAVDAVGCGKVSNQAGEQNLRQAGQQDSRGGGTGHEAGGHVR
jgi:hypothetical protein